MLVHKLRSICIRNVFDGILNYFWFGNLFEIWRKWFNINFCFRAFEIFVISSSCHIIEKWYEFLFNVCTWLSGIRLFDYLCEIGHFTSCFKVSSLNFPGSGVWSISINLLVSKLRILTHEAFDLFPLLLVF